MSVDYRLAPEHPYPAAVEDALAAYEALLDNGIAPSDIAFAGESARRTRRRHPGQRARSRAASAGRGLRHVTVRRSHPGRDDHGIQGARSTRCSAGSSSKPESPTTRRDGEAFYFDGLLKFIYNGAAFAPAGGKTITAGVPVSSGVLSPQGPKSPPAKATYTFPKAGVFQLLCTVHPGMKVSVAVKAAGTPVPLSPAQVAAASLVEISAAWTKATPLAGQSVPKNTVYAGVGGSPTILSYYPQVLTVKAGTTVKFINKSPSEVHNVAFGPAKYLQAFQKTTDFLPAGPGSKNQVTPVFTYGTDPKGSYSYDGANHGNGFFQTPLTAGLPGTPLPRAAG